MSSTELANLARIHKLKKEAPDRKEISGLIANGRRLLLDAESTSISDEGRFSLVYIAAHSLALAALRQQGYRSDSRYLVFQCLQHTVGLEKAKWLVLDRCHKRRNAAEYEGEIQISAGLLEEFLEITKQILTVFEKLN